MGPPEGKSPEIDKVSKNITKIMKFDVNCKKNGSRVLGVTSMRLPSETKFYVLVSPSQRQLKMQNRFFDLKVINIYHVISFKAPGAPNGSL